VYCLAFRQWTAALDAALDAGIGGDESQLGIAPEH
jgi:hypothetical protein